MEENQANLVRVDERVSKMYDIVLKMKSDLNNITDQQYKTNGLFKYNPSLSTPAIKIQTETRINVLLSALGFVLSKKEEYDNAAKTVKLSKYPIFKWADYTAEDWTHDISLRIELVNHKEKIDALREAENELTALLTKDERTNRKLNELSKKLGLENI